MTSSSNTEKDMLCLCKVINPGLTVCKIFGLFPVAYCHENNYCRFKTSKFLLIYSIMCTSVFILHTFLGTEILNLFTMTKDKAVHEIISDATDMIYCIFATAITILNATKRTKFIEAFNHLHMVFKQGLFCQSSLRIFYKVQYGYLFILTIILGLQYATIGYLHFSDRFEETFDIKLLVTKLMQLVTFLVYLLITCTISYFQCILACFKKMFFNNLNFTPVHPLENFDKTNNTIDILGIVKYKICTGNHAFRCTILSEAQLIEHLRKLHEDICLILYEFNSALNPLLLFQMLTEITVLVINWYAIVLYMIRDFGPGTRTIHILNCFFVCTHSVCLFQFLRSCQRLHNMVYFLRNYLLECSTRTSNSAVQLQLRLFIEKINQYKPINANSIFTIDLGIAGPICANVLTYVLVALQFEVTK